MATGFEAGALERRYAFLDECPASLVPAVVTLPIGTLDERVSGVRRWHDALQGGRLPPAGTWPQAPIDIPVRKALESMGLVRFCKDQPELVEALMTDILSAFGRQNAEFRSEVAGRLHELEELERVRQTEAEAERARREKRATREVRLDEATMRRLREMAEREVAKRDREADPEVVATWGDRARAWSEIADVFGDLGEMLGRGWDLSIGVLKHTGWLDVLRREAPPAPRDRACPRAPSRDERWCFGSGDDPRSGAPARRGKTRGPNAPRSGGDSRHRKEWRDRSDAADRGGNAGPPEAPAGLARSPRRTRSADLPGRRRGG